MFPVLPQTIISLLQTAQHDSRTLSLNPFGLHVAGSDDPPFLSQESEIIFLENFKTNSDKYINLTSLLKNMQNDENDSTGEYYSLNSKIWKLLEINRKTDSRGRIHVNETNFEKEIRVFVSDVDRELETCKNYVLLPHSIFTEIRKSRIKDQTGEPLKVQSSGDVWMGSANKNKFVKVFVRMNE